MAHHNPQSSYMDKLIIPWCSRVLMILHVELEILDDKTFKMTLIWAVWKTLHGCFQTKLRWSVLVPLTLWRTLNEREDSENGKPGCSVSLMTL